MQAQVRGWIQVISKLLNILWCTVRFLIRKFKGIGHVATPKELGICIELSNTQKSPVLPDLHEGEISHGQRL